jgi:hypothetical protein
LIPPFDHRGLLPVGLHDCSLQEIRETLGFNERRKVLVDGLERYLRCWDGHLAVESIIVDGSFSTDKAEPGDIDLLIVLKHEAEFSQNLEELIFQLCYDSRETKDLFGCEAFPVLGSDTENYRGWLEFFGKGRTGEVRGLLRVRLPL